MLREWKPTLEELEEMMDESGGWLDLSGCTGLTELPDGLTVGGWLDLSGCTGLQSKNLRRLKDGEYVPGRYLYADGILTHVKRKIHLNGYDYYLGKIPGKNVVSDGKNFAHCSTFREGIEDLLFKAAEDRGADQYKGLTLDSVLSLDEAKTMYRVITGACRAGTQAFVDSLGDKVKDHYTVREMIDVTQGQYGASSFQEFFDE